MGACSSNSSKKLCVIDMAILLCFPKNIFAFADH